MAKAKKKTKKKVRSDKGGKHKPGAGRPPLELDPIKFRELCRIQCTLKEIAGVMETTEKTLIEWVKRTYGENFYSVYQKYSAGGKMSLRRAMFRNAIGSPSKEWTDSAGVKQNIQEIRPNATTQIWLSKQHVGMTDKHEVEVNVKPFIIEGPNGKTVAELGSQNVIEGEVIDAEAIEDAEKNYYDNDELAKEGEDHEHTETQSGK